MSPTPEHVDGWERAMEYLTLKAAGDDAAAALVLTQVFANFDTALSFTVMLGNVSTALVQSSAKTFRMTPSEFWTHCATRLQATRPPEWER